MSASPKGSMSSRITGESPGMALPTSGRSSLGGFQGLGRSSVAHHSEKVPSPSGFSRVRVSDDGRVKMESFEELIGRHAARCPRLVSGCFSPPQAVMLTLNRYPLRLGWAGIGHWFDERWLPYDGALHLPVGEIRRASMRLSNGRLSLECAYRC